jgi:hypothetical protein
MIRTSRPSILSPRHTQGTNQYNWASSGAHNDLILGTILGTTAMLGTNGTFSDLDAAPTALDFAVCSFY